MERNAVLLSKASVLTGYNDEQVRTHWHMTKKTHSDDPRSNFLNCNSRNKHSCLSLYLPFHLTPSALFLLSSEGMSPLGLAVRQPDPYMAGCAAPAADCPSNTSRGTFSQEDHACCPFDLASSSCCSTQQHFVHVSSPHSVLRHRKTEFGAEVKGEKGRGGKI